MILLGKSANIVLDYKLLIFIKIQSKQEFSFTKHFKTIYPNSLLVGTLSYLYIKVIV